MNAFVICSFMDGGLGKICRNPSDGKGAVRLHPQNKIDPPEGDGYVCRIVKDLPEIRLVCVEKGIARITQELGSILMGANWVRGTLPTDSITAKVPTYEYGLVTATWLETNGLFNRQRGVRLNFTMGISPLEVACDASDRHGVDMERLAERVHACTGKYLDLSALISRPFAKVWPF